LPYILKLHHGYIKILQGNHSNTGGSTTANSDSSTNGQVYLFGLSCNQAFATSGSAGLSANNGDYDTSAINTSAFTFNGTGFGGAQGCFISSGSASAVSIGSGNSTSVTGCIIYSTNTNAITGAGTLHYGDISFSNFSTYSTLINTTTQVPNIASNDAIRITTPGAYPYTTIPQDGVILVDTSTARTIVPLASPSPGQRHVIKDNVGSALTNNITITPSGKNIDGAASATIALNYGSARIVFNGTQWNVI